MTPQFLRAEAARFREMAEAVTEREASRQRLLAMAIDYESRANVADVAQPTEQMPDAEPEPASDEDVTIKASKTTQGDRRPRTARTMTLPNTSGTPGV